MEGRLRMNLKGINGYSSSVQDEDESNPFGSKPVLVKSPSLSKLKQRTDSRLYTMGNNNTHDIDNDIAYSENKDHLPSTDNSRRINVVGRSSTNNGFETAKNGLDTSQISGKSIISVSHAGSPSTVDSDSNYHLPEVKMDHHSRSKYYASNSRQTSKTKPAIIPHLYVKSQYHNSNFGSDSYEDDFESSSSSSNEERIQDPMSFSISKITRDRLLQKQGKLMREAEERRAALKTANNNVRIPPTSHSNHSDPGPRRHERSYNSDPPLESNYHKSISTSSIATRRPPIKQQNNGVVPTRSRSLGPSNRFKAQPSSKALSKNRKSDDSKNRESHRSLTDSSAGFSMDKVRVTHLNNPTEALKSAQKSLASDNWTIKIEGMQTMLSLITYHHNVILPELHNVVIAINKEVKNLRSSVSRLAINCVSEMFIKLKKNMDTDLELVARPLFQKSGENSGFIREDVEKALMNMIQNVSPSKAVFVVVVAGASHRNPAVRKMAALCMMKLVDKLGANKIIGGTKDFSEKVLPTASQFIVDGNPVTRYYGKRIFHQLMEHHHFERCMNKYVQPTTLRNINNALESIRHKGVGECPSEATSSAKSRHPDMNSRGSTLSKTM
ncbi:TOG array regulator of axonemal microtubules protein 1 [Nymphon striatum]|nr:TOG array regulator of axonemal microtubules protein 1 [Nymphon striatum]